MRTRVVLWILVLGAAGLLWPGRAAAQGNAQISLSTTSAAFPTPGMPQFNAGYVDYGSVDVSITSRPVNRAWEIRIRAVAPTLGLGKPVEDLQWRLEGSSVWHDVTTSAEAVLQSSGDQTVRVHFRMVLDWSSDGPGAYATDLDLSVLRI